MLFNDFRFYRNLEREKRENPDYTNQIRDLRQAKWSSFRSEAKKPLYVLAAVAMLAGTLYLDNKNQDAQEMRECMEESRYEKSPLECLPGIISHFRL